MKTAAVWIFSIFVVLALGKGCADSERIYRENLDKVETQIKECIADGGTPIFTQTKGGEVVEFLGCTPP